MKNFLLLLSLILSTIIHLYAADEYCNDLWQNELEAPLIQSLPAMRDTSFHYAYLDYCWASDGPLMGTSCPTPTRILDVYEWQENNGCQQVATHSQTCYPRVTGNSELLSLSGNKPVIKTSDINLEIDFPDCEDGPFTYSLPSPVLYDTILSENPLHPTIENAVCELWNEQSIETETLHLRNIIDCSRNLPLTGPEHDITLKENLGYGIGKTAGLTGTVFLSITGDTAAPPEGFFVPYMEAHGITIKPRVRPGGISLTDYAGGCNYLLAEPAIPGTRLFMTENIDFSNNCLQIENIDANDIILAQNQSYAEDYETLVAAIHQRIENSANFTISGQPGNDLVFYNSENFRVDISGNIFLTGNISAASFGLAENANYVGNLYTNQLDYGRLWFHHSGSDHGYFKIEKLGHSQSHAQISTMVIRAYSGGFLDSWLDINHLILKNTPFNAGNSHLSINTLDLETDTIEMGGDIPLRVGQINGHGANAYIFGLLSHAGGTEINGFTELAIGKTTLKANGIIHFYDIDELSIHDTDPLLNARILPEFSDSLDIEVEEVIGLSLQKKLLKNYTITQLNENAMISYVIRHQLGEMWFHNVRKLTLNELSVPEKHNSYRVILKEIPVAFAACLNTSNSPVFAKDGAYFRQETDLQVNTRERELSFQRTYISNNSSFSAIGAKWGPTGQYRLLYFPKGATPRLELYWGEGNSTRLWSAGGGLYRSEDQKFMVTFMPGVSSVSVIGNDATTFTFINLPVPDSPLPGHYVLQRISGRESFDLLYEYDSTGKLNRIAEVPKGAEQISITDPALEFSYNGQNLLYSVSANGRNVHYYEYDQSRLIRVSNSDGQKIRYLYDDEDHPYQITGVFAAGGARISTIEYDRLARVSHYIEDGEEAFLTYNENGEVLYSQKNRAGLEEEVRNSFYEDIKVDTKERTADGQTIRTKYLWDGSHNIGVVNAENIISVRSFGPDGIVTAEKLLSVPYHEGMTTADLSSAALWAQTGLDTFYEYEYCQGLPVIRSIRRQMTNEPDERVENYTYNADCRLLTRRLGDGGSRIVYNADGQVFQEWQEEYEGDILVGSFLLREITYDQYGFVASIKTGHGNANGQYTVTQVNDQWGNVLQRIDERGVIHIFEYDNNNRITKSRITNPDDAAEYVETSYSYDHAGRLKRIDRPGGAYSEMGYDAHNRLLYTVDQFERVTSFVYDSAGRLVKRIEPTGNIIRHEYNAFGNLIQTSDESGSTEQYSFDRLFRMSEQTDADGYSTSMAYDQYGRLRERNTHLNEEIILSEQYHHDAWGLRTSDSDYRGFTRNYDYDNRQRLSEQKAYGFNSALHYTRQSEYDILDRPTSIDINGRENIFANDYTQSEFTSTDPLNRQVKNVLDAAGNVLSTIDPSGAVRSYEYDYLGRLKKKTRPDGVNSNYEYNERLNLSAERVKDSNGNLLLLHLHEYDNGDRRVKTTITDYTTNLSVELNYSYDRGNRLLKVHELPADTEIRYTYDKASRISTVTIPAQHRELRYVYDGRGNKVNIYIYNSLNRRMTMQAFEYDALNRLTYAYSEYYGEVHIEYFDGEFTSTEELRRRVTYPSGIKAEFYHDAFDRPIRIAWIKDDNQIMAHSYEYDSFDRIIRKTVDSPSGQRQENYSFDLADRLIAALTPEGTINYDYDQNDNMTSIYHSGNTERQVNFATDNQYQELLTGVDYPAFGRSFTFGLDALGRRITDQNISNNALHVRTYAFDPMSRLSAVSSVKSPLPNAEPWPAEELEYSYLPGSPLRRTLTKQQPAQTTQRHFIWDGANELESLSEFTAGGNTDYFAEIFLSDPAIMDKRFGVAKNLNAFVDEAAEGIDYITDQQNTINASYKNGNVTDEQHFSPYGHPVTFTLPEGTELTKFAYTGRNYDAPADLYYYRGRYYDACSARFLNPDPSENGMNWTGYVGGDPINMVDPSGYYTFENGEVDEEKEWVSSETPYSPFTIENQCVEISPNWRKAKEQIAILKQIQSDLINKIDRLSEKDPIGLLYRETASSTERRRKEYILTELRSLLDSKSKKVYVQPGLYDGVREGRHNFFTRNITIHTPQTDSLKLQYFLLHESMHHLDSFNLNSSSYDKSGLMREIFWESYVYPNYTERNKFQSGKQAPYNADSAASWLNYLLR